MRVESLSAILLEQRSRVLHLCCGSMFKPSVELLTLLLLGVGVLEGDEGLQWVGRSMPRLRG